MERPIVVVKAESPVSGQDFWAVRDGNPDTIAQAVSQIQADMGKGAGSYGVYRSQTLGIVHIAPIQESQDLSDQIWGWEWLGFLSDGWGSDDF